MATYSSPLGIDNWAPAQYVFGGTGGGGPDRSPEPMNATASSQTFDPTLHWKIGGTVILALVTVFVLQMMGFRFVGAASVGFGKS